MVTVDNGIITRGNENFVYVKPRCPHCGYLEQSSWNEIMIGVPRMMHSKSSNGFSCTKCYKTYRITVYPGC